MSNAARRRARRMKGYFVRASPLCLAAILSACSDDCCNASIGVIERNRPPTATPTSAVVAEDGSVGIRLAGTDVDGSVAAYSVATSPANGTLSGTPPDLTYAPDAEFHGQDEFTFTVTDDDGAVSGPARVAIEVTPVNDPPVALAQRVEVVGGEAVDIVLQGTDIDGTVSAYAIATQPGHGTLTGAAPDLTYVADARYAGADAFSFTVDDDAGAVSEPAQVTIEVTAAACRGDRAVLETLYWATNGEGWARSDGWLENDDLAQWHGVAAHGLCVTGLQLPENSLQGTMPWQLGSLDMLEILDFGNYSPEEECSRDEACHRNALTGGIPRELGNLANLESLLLARNGLSGPVPVEIANLATLRSLDLRANALTGPIPIELGNLTELRVLDLGFNDLSGPVPVELANLPLLRWLSLGSNGLSGPIPARLARLASLETLWLGSNDLTGPIPVELGALAGLRSLDLRSNDLTGAIPAELAKLSNLVFLLLSINPLTGPIPVELARLSKLETLELSGNGLSGPIPDRFSELASLRSLDLRSNKLSGAIPAELSKLSGLELLLLADNDLTGPIPIGLSDLADLETLWLGNNGLSGAVPAELANLSNLESLWLGGNGLTGPVPPELANLDNLVELRLERNALSGPIPPQLGRLDRLWVLDLGRNALTGAVPGELGLLSNVTFVSLEENALSGAVPAALGSLPLVNRSRATWKSLRLSVMHRPSLLLGGNALSGTVPAEIGRLETAEALTLDRNRLTGRLPAGMTSMTGLRTFRFARNDGLCAPGDDAFQAWLQGIPERDDGLTCQ